ncbi:amidohydrolase [Marinicauda algicola]|uniref:Amidohydrolase n=1 Tax=Marinicauda algicola TaxID=2029849 RepID=A0A4S2GYZ4_9PROT|nr:amidohydrolase family protein [Marinicauda algicola]TGY88405.1 amidohydrolase [Marinicauda algicola]
MSHDWVKLDKTVRTRLAETTEADSPIPARIVSNGEYTPPPQSRQQAAVQVELGRLAEIFAPQLGLGRRDFLRSSLGMAAAFAALNSVFGSNYAVAQDEYADPDSAAERALLYRDQYIFDGHLHFVHDDYAWPGILGFRNAARAMGALAADARPPTFEDVKFGNFIKEVFFDSDTTAGIVTTATSDDPSKVFLSNAQISTDVDRFNAATGSQRLFKQCAFHPGAPGWRDQIEEAIAIHRPLSWKGYTIGDPLTPHSRHPWRLDDEDLVYPAFERFAQAGITTVCIHKGLVPGNYADVIPDLWRHAIVDDVGKAARDWQQLNFVIYHAALQPVVLFDPAFKQRFEETGRMNWVSDLADIPARFGVSNVYADVGTSFGQGAITEPRLAAALMAILVKGLGEDRVLWGSDSVWWGSPQWQIEAFRRIEVAEDLQERFSLPALGSGQGALKTRIFGENSAALYRLPDSQRTVAGFAGDGLAQAKAAYVEAGPERSNAVYGFVREMDGQ